MSFEILRAWKIQIFRKQYKGQLINFFIEVAVQEKAKILENHVGYRREKSVFIEMTCFRKGYVFETSKGFISRWKH